MRIMNPFLPRLLFLTAPLVGLVGACGSTVTDVGRVDDAGPRPDAGPGALGDGASLPDSGGPAVVVPPGAKRLFITSKTFHGDLGAGGGLAGGDASCTSAAQAAGLGGSWKAWLSTTTVDAIDRIVEVGPWYDLAGTVIFSGKTNLTTSPLAGLWIDENKAMLASDRIWTGTGFGGTYLDQLSGTKPCADWTSGAMSEQAKIGQVGRSDGAAWTAYTGTTCDQNGHLLCLEQ